MMLRLVALLCAVLAQIIWCNPLLAQAIEKSAGSPAVVKLNTRAPAAQPRRYISVGRQQGIAPKLTAAAQPLASCRGGRIGVLLPQTGPLAGLGRRAEKAVASAFFELDNPDLELLFFDTGSTASGAAMAYNMALIQGTCLVLGPITDQETAGIQTHMANGPIPVFALTNNRAVAGGAVTVFGPSLEQRLFQAVGSFKPDSQILLVSRDDRSRGLIEAAAYSAGAFHNVEIADNFVLSTDWQLYMDELHGVVEASSQVDGILVTFGDDGLVMLAGMLARLEGDDGEQDVAPIQKIAVGSIDRDRFKTETVFAGWQWVVDPVMRPAGKEQGLVGQSDNGPEFLERLAYDAVFYGASLLSHGANPVGVYQIITQSRKTPFGGLVWAVGGGVRRCVTVEEARERYGSLRWKAISDACQG